MNTLLVWEKYPVDIKFFRIAEGSEYYSTVMASAGKYDGEEGISEDDPVIALSEAINAGKLDAFEVNLENGIIEEAFCRLVVCGCFA
jgi:hypothetical protein